MPSTAETEVLSPASGRILEVKSTSETTTISIFLGPFRNHDQYVPIDSVVSKVVRIRGGNMPAFLGMARHNNGIETRINTKIGKMRIRQITGILFRRIINDLRGGERLKQGSLLGHIVFGSRVEIDMPVKCVILIKNGEHVVGGKTIIAKIKH